MKQVRAKATVVITLLRATELDQGPCFQLKKPPLKQDVSIFSYFPLILANTFTPQKVEEIIIYQV